MGSYTTFFPLYFTQGVRDGIITYHHLWFILYLFVFSLVTLPLLLALRSRRARPLMDRLAAFLARPGAIFLLPLPLVLTEIAFRARYPGYYNFVDDWANVALFAGMLVAGFVVVSDVRIMDAIRRQWRLALAVAAVLTTTILLMVWIIGDRPAPGYSSPAYIPFCAATVLNTWCWIVGLFGAGQAIFRRRTRLLAYASEVSYPLYILHQTVLVALAFYITPLSISIAAKFALIALPTLLISAGLVELAKLTGVTRFLLGMRPRRAA